MAANTAAAMRLCAGLGVCLHIIEPCGFVWDERKLKQVAMDYLPLVNLTRHAGWEAFVAWAQGRRIVLFSSKAGTPYTSFAFHSADCLMFGRESAGVPDEIARQCTALVTIPMAAGARCLNVVTSAAMGLGEFLRQTKS